MRNIPSFVYVLLASVGLMACSSENPKISIGKSIPNILNELKLKKQEQQQGNALEGLKRAQLKDIKGPFLVAYLEDIEAFSTLSPVAQNGAVRTFLTPDNITVSLQNGILTSTRGLSEDLMSADVSAAVLAIRKGRGAEYSRLYRWLDGEDNQVQARFQCSLAFVDTAKVEIVELVHKARHLQETCVNTQQTIMNDYWIGIGKPVIWQSRQWVGPGLGYLRLTVLVPE